MPGFGTQLKSIVFTIKTFAVPPKLKMVSVYCLALLFINLFLHLHVFWFLEKIALREICLTGTVIITKILQNSPTYAYISK